MKRVDLIRQNEILYGRQPVREALVAKRRRVARIILAAEPSSDVIAEIVAEAGKSRIQIRQADQRELDGLCEGGHHQGVAAEVSGYPYVDLQGILALAGEGGEAPFLLLLDHIQDPQNLGSILRSAEAVGVHGVILPKDRAVGVTPAVVRASSGASEHMLVAQVTNLAQTMSALKADNVWLAGLEVLPESRLCAEADLRGSIGLVVGSEGKGLGRLVRETCDFHIKLPMLGRITSLNAAVACAVALFEIRRQRDFPVCGGISDRDRG